jgi:hypothetical protein
VARAHLRAALAGEDGPGTRALPAGELLHPLPLAALIVLVANDWLAKPSAAVPDWLSGKLSDVAGLLLAPLCATALFDCALWLVARLGPSLDFSLHRGRLHGVAIACGAAFTAVKLSPAAASALERAAGWIGLDWRVVTDPSDLIALPALAIAVWLGRREIARVPLGRLEVLERRWRVRGQLPGPALAEGGPKGQPTACLEPPTSTPSSTRFGLSDVVRCGADPAQVERLASALESYFRGGPPEPARDALARLRGPA